MLSSPAGRVMAEAELALQCRVNPDPLLLTDDGTSALSMGAGRASNG